MPKVNTPDDVGKTLQEILEKYKDEYCYVAASNCFIYIGKPSEDDYIQIFDNLTKYFTYSNEYNLELLKNKKEAQFLSFKNAQAWYDSAVPNTKEFVEAKKNLRRETTKMKTANRKFDELNQIISNKIGLLGREVTDTYDRNLDPPYGKIISIKGRENGFAWDIEEFHKGYQKILKSLN